jgi:hypothetical protein
MDIKTVPMDDKTVSMDDKSKAMILVFQEGEGPPIFVTLTSSDLLTLRKTQINLVFHSICTTFFPKNSMVMNAFRIDGQRAVVTGGGWQLRKRSLPAGRCRSVRGFLNSTFASSGSFS